MRKMKHHIVCSATSIQKRNNNLLFILAEKNYRISKEVIEKRFLFFIWMGLLIDMWRCFIYLDGFVDPGLLIQLVVVHDELVFAVGDETGAYIVRQLADVGYL